MRHFCKLGLVLLPVIVLALAGCGGSSGTSGTADPFASTTSTTSTTSGTGTGVVTTPATVSTPVTAQSPEFSLTLTSDLKKVDVNNGTVLLTAELLNMSGGVFIDPVSNQPIASGAAVPNQTVTFNVLAGPGSIGYTTAVSDKNGVSNAIYTSGNVNYTTDVIVEATVTVDGNNYRGYASFQIVRGGGVIMFTDLAGMLPGGQSNLLKAADFQVDPNVGPAVDIMQLIPFKVTDSNNNPRVGVPVTISVYSITTLNPNDVLVDFLVPPVTEASQQTITTDSAGQGIFNGRIRLSTPDPGLTNTVDVVFKAVTNDASPIVAYVGGSYTLTTKLPALAIAPASAAFGNATDITFTISGGVPPYKVTSSKADTVSVTLKSDGVTVLAHLVDTTAWTDAVTISVTDSASQTASATVSR